MNRLKTRFFLRLAAFGLPFAALLVLGCLWLTQRGLLLAFVVATSLLSVGQWLALRWLRWRPAAYVAMPPPSGTWPPAGEQAWADVDRLAARVEANTPAWGDANAWTVLFYEVLDTVARHFHPESKRPALEVPISDAIRIAELVAADLRAEWHTRVPAAEQITLHHVYRTVEWTPKVTKLGEQAWNLWRLGRFLVSPARALVAEVGSVFAGGWADLTTELPAMAAAYCVRRTGKYAIDLYSGQLPVDEIADSGAHESKPLRIVVLGQVKAGKSSLINALFGDTRAATDVLPCTDTITPYVIEREGLCKAIIYDTVGFGGAGDLRAQQRLNDELEQSDLAIVVASAGTAAREADRKLLDEARLRLERRALKSPPPIVVALSHIDIVRPIAEWNPPYDFRHGQSAKERNVRDALQAVADDLQVAGELVAPMCLRAGAVYNIEEALLPIIARVMSSAERAKLLRLLMEDRDARQREDLKLRLLKAGVAAAELAVALAQRWGESPRDGVATEVTSP